MGIPKFFRWLSERYPKINQRFGSEPNPETVQRHFNDPTLDPSIHYEARKPDPLSKCVLPPDIDRLYIDMNGILHGCSHNNATKQSGGEDDTPDEIITSSSLTVEEIFQNVRYYLDRIVSDIAKPKELVYMAIDGVAPRAKLNQQRSRRYRSGQEGEIAQTVYQAHLMAMKSETHDTITMEHSITTANRRSGGDQLDDDDDDSSQQLQEVIPGRFAGKFEAHSSTGVRPPGGRGGVARHIRRKDDDNDDDWTKQRFHNHFITPGTPFMEAVSKVIQEFVQHKLNTDPKWQNLTIIFSGSNVPGEGEHKIMEFIRHQKRVADPNTRHCIMGQDGDWIVLGLVTHEPNLVLLREKIEFGSDTAPDITVHGYMHNPNFEFLHLNVLRDYLAYDLETSNVVSSSPFDLEHTLDDFCFMTFLIGNDFLPHLPALDIADEALELLFGFYKKQRQHWLESNLPPYLTDKGDIVSGARLEQFLSAVGAHENTYYDNKKRWEVLGANQMRDQYKKFGYDENIFPSPDETEQMEEMGRAKYREMMMMESISSDSVTTESNRFQPVMTVAASVAALKDGKAAFEPQSDEDREEGFVTRLKSLLEISLKPSAQSSPHDDATAGTLVEPVELNDQDLKGRYYYDKFGFSPFDAERHIALRKAYMEGLVWNLKYYYAGCVSWDWHYPYHYGPMISDLVDLDEILKGISFPGKSKPLKPFEQLLACLPPSSAFQLPKPYRWLMTDSSSPISDFYPTSFVVDMNGKRWPWEAVALLPFVDKKRLLRAAAKVKDEQLTEDEQRRNRTGHALVYERQTTMDNDDAGASSVALTPFDASTKWKYKARAKPIFEPRLTPGVTVPLPGFATLQAVPIKKLLKARSGINVFNSRSRYTTVFLVTTEEIPYFPPLETIVPKMIGETALINYPYFTEALITSVSNASVVYRGNEKPMPLNENEASRWSKTYQVLRERHASGEGFTGTGGWYLPTTKEAMKLSVRPFKGLKMLDDGTVGKVFAPFEIEVPLVSAIWSPDQADPRISNLPLLLEKDPYHMPLLQQQPVFVKENEGRDVLPDQETRAGEEPVPLSTDDSRVVSMFTTQLDGSKAPALQLLAPAKVDTSMASDIWLSALPSMPKNITPEEWMFNLLDSGIEDHMQVPNFTDVVSNQKESPNNQASIVILPRKRKAFPPAPDLHEANDRLQHQQKGLTAH